METEKRARKPVGQRRGVWILSAASEVCVDIIWAETSNIPLKVPGVGVAEFWARRAPDM